MENHNKLHWAACKGILDNVRQLTETENLHPLQRDKKESEDGFMPVHYAAFHGHLPVVKYFMSKLKCDPNIPGLWGRTPLHCASQEGHLNIVRYIIEDLQCHPLCTDQHQVTPLHLAAKHGHLDVVKCLTLSWPCKVQSGYSDKLSRCSNGSTPLNQAVLNGHLEVVKFFLSELKCDPNTPGEYNRSPLHDASQGGHMEVVEYLINELKCDPPCIGVDKVSPIHLAAKYGHLEVVKYLVRNCQCNLDSSLNEVASHGTVESFSLSGYNGHPKTQDHLGRTPICYAAQAGHLHIVEYLLEFFESKQISVVECLCTALKLATKHAHLRVVEHISPKLCVRKNYHTFLQLLNIAVFQDHHKLVQHFVSKLKCVPVYIYNFHDTLRHAIEQDHLDIVKYLIKEANLDPSAKLHNIYLSYKLTPLHLAVNYGYLNVVKYLVNEMKCNPLSTTSWGTTAVHIAAAKGHLEILKFFLQLNNTYISAKDEHGRTLLYEAIRKGQLNVVNYFLQAHTKIEPFEYQVTPLHLASGNGHLDIIKYLVEKKGCNELACDSYNNTPLHWAAYFGQFEVVEYFIKIRNSPGIDIKGFNEMTPLRLARNQGHTSVAHYLTTI